MIVRQTIVAALLLPTALFPAVVAHAQAPPDAGSLQQQIERERRPQLPRRSTTERPAEPAAMDVPAGVTLTVKAFRFAGNTLLTNQQLAVVVAAYLNRTLGFAELQKAAADVANAYREAGWIVRAYLPRQDITEGIVTIQIVEAVFGGVHFEGPGPARYKRASLLKMFDRQQKAGAPLNADALDRALLLADDLPGVTVSGSLREGAAQGETDLVLNAGDEPLFGGEALLDNFGSRSTGKDRVSANLNLNSSLGVGDIISANLLHTQGSDYLRLGGIVPIGFDGWRVGLNGTRLNYKLVAPEFAALGAKGSFDAVGLETSYPLVRSRLKNLYFNANFDHKSYDNQSGGATTTRYKADAATLGFAGNLFDNLGGGGANSANLSLVAGRINLDGSPNQAADAATTQTAGHYSKLRYAASRQQVINNDFSFYAALSGQVAGKNLDSSEKFYLGGASGVRAYPSNEGAGSEGKLLNLELRRKLPEGFSVVGFYDYGHVTVNRSNGFAGAAVLNDYSLKGAGLTLAWQGGKGTQLKATWAHRIGDNPNPTASGSDQDGTLKRNRIWLMAIQQFE